MQLDLNDLRFAVARLPVALRNLMMKPEWSNQIFVGGGYIRCIITGDKINDVDVFAKSYKDAESIANILAPDKKSIVITDNAFTVKGKCVIQVIHRWTFNKLENVSNSFDFTCCCAAIGFEIEEETPFNLKENKKWKSYCDERFYMDVASKRLVYRSPQRNEDAGGSILRVLKYYQKGFRIPLDSLGAVIARLMKGFDVYKTELTDEVAVAKVITGLLRQVDPMQNFVDEAHMPPLELGSGELVEPLPDVAPISKALQDELDEFEKKLKRNEHDDTWRL